MQYEKQIVLLVGNMILLALNFTAQASEHM